MPFHQQFRQSGEEGTASVDHSLAPPRSSHFWPDAVAFREAVQQPSSVFADPLLKQANVSVDRRGLPVAYSGRFAIVFRFTSADGERWAVRCFTSGTDSDERRSRYFLIASHIEDLGDIVVPFRYVDRGIQVNGQWFPVLAMPWVPGEPLGRFVERHLNDAAALRHLAGVLTALQARLESAGVGHGDWQHDNLLVSEGGKHVTLVDYDGMFVPEFEGRSCPEAGHPNYQHPYRTAAHFDARVDRFSCIAIQTALLALADDPGIWRGFSDGESLLFRKSDFVSPGTSPLFSTLRELAKAKNDTLLAESIACLEDACRANVGETLSPVVPAIAGQPPVRPLTHPVSASSGAARMSTEFLFTPAGNGAKWWQDEKVVLPRRTPLASAQLTAETSPFQFVRRLAEPDALAEERKNLRQARAMVPASLALIAFSVFWITEHAHFWPWYVCFWMLNVGNMGYNRWPRKRLYDELNGEIQKMRKLIEGRQQELATAMAQIGIASASPQDFVANALRKRDIVGLIHPPYNLLSKDISALREAGIVNASQLQHRIDVPNVGSAQMNVIHRWVDDLATEAQDEFRQATSARSAATGLMHRKRDEISQFEREIVRLETEKAAFPDSSFAAYVRRLVGMNTVTSNPGVP